MRLRRKAALGRTGTWRALGRREHARGSALRREWRATRVRRGAVTGSGPPARATWVSGAGDPARVASPGGRPFALARPHGEAHLGVTLPQASFPRVLVDGSAHGT